MTYHRHTRSLLYLVAASGCFAMTASANCKEPLLPRTIACLTAGDPVTIACLGDSATGIYYHTSGRRAYPEMLKIGLGEKFPQCPLRVVNAGISGNTSADGLSRLKKEVLSHQPELVTVMFGLNDVRGVSVDKFLARMSQIIDECRAAQAEVLLCPPNGVEETEARPVSKLLDFCPAIRTLGREKGVPVADVYAAYDTIREHDATEFSLLLSDAIHPNLHGHKLTASVIAQVIIGEPVTLTDELPPAPSFPRIHELLTDNKPIQVLAMPPYDDLIGPALRNIKPNATVRVSTWDVARKSLNEIEADAKRVRDQRPDLVVVAVPWMPSMDSIPAFARTYGGILNLSLSFGRQEWDVLAVLPSVDQSANTNNQRQQETYATAHSRAGLAASGARAQRFQFC